MEKLNIAKAIEYYRDRFNQKQLLIDSVALDQEVLDFINEQLLGDQFRRLVSMARPFLGKHFNARVRVDDLFIIFEIVSFDGEVLATDKSNRGADLQGEYCFNVFTISDLDVKVEIGVAENSYSKAEKIEMQKQSKLFFAPYPIKKYLFM